MLGVSSLKLRRVFIVGIKIRPHPMLSMILLQGFEDVVVVSVEQATVGIRD